MMGTETRGLAAKLEEMQHAYGMYYHAPDGEAEECPILREHIDILAEAAAALDAAGEREAKLEMIARGVIDIQRNITRSGWQYTEGPDLYGDLGALEEIAKRALFDHGGENGR